MLHTSISPQLLSSTACLWLRAWGGARREYEGKLSQRCNVQSMSVMNYAEESQRLIEMIAKLTPVA